MKRIGLIIIVAAGMWAWHAMPLHDGTVNAQTLPAECKYLDATCLLWYTSTEQAHDTIRATASGWSVKETQSLETGDGNLSLWVKGIRAVPAACSIYVRFQRSNDNSRFIKLSDTTVALINDTTQHIYDIPLPNMYSTYVQLYFVVDSGSAFQAHVGKR